MFILCLKSSHAMGMGHLFRMINLYGALRRSGATATIVLLGEHAPAREWLEKSGIPFEAVPDSVVECGVWEAGLVSRLGAKTWVNDRLQTDAGHAVRIKAAGLSLVTFDDLGPGAALADIHVAALASVHGDDPQGVKVLAGLKYLILAPEIARFRRHRTESGSLVVSLGGSDTYGVTVKVAQWLSARRQPATLILGPGFEHEEALGKIVSEGDFTVKRSVPSLAAEFARHDLAITAGGMTAFEAAAAGLPTLTVANETWEVVHCRHLQALGCSVFAGPHENIDFGLWEARPDIATMSAAALQAADAEGVERVCLELLSL